MITPSPFFAEVAQVAGYEDDASHAEAQSDLQEQVLSPVERLQLLLRMRSTSVVDMLRDLREKGVPAAKLPAALKQISHLAHTLRYHDAGVILQSLVAPQHEESRYDRVYSTTAKGFIDNANPDPLVQHLIEEKYLHGGEVVLDDGAGNGRNAHALAQAGAKKCLAVDNSPSAHLRARSLSEENPSTRDAVTIICESTKDVLDQLVKSGQSIDLYIAISRFHLDPRRFGNNGLPSFEERLAFVRDALSERGILAFTLKTPESPTIKKGQKLYEWDGGVSVWSGTEAIGRWAETTGNLVRAVQGARFEIVCATTQQYPYDTSDQKEIFNWIIARKIS